MERRLKPRQKWCNAVASWIRDLQPKGISTSAMDGLRYAVPHAAKYGNDDGYMIAAANKVQVQTVLPKTSAELRRENIIGDKTMEALGRFLRDHGAKLADGWDGS